MPQPTRSSRKRSSRPSFEPQYQTLEPRNLLASFVGTDDADQVVVTFVDSAPRYIEINGVVHDNLDATADLNLMDGVDEITFVGDAFDITVVGDDLLEDGPGSGTANGVFDFTFESQLELTTGELADSVDVTGSGPAGFRIDINTGDGNDTVIYRGGSVSITQGDGDDYTQLLKGHLDDMPFFDAGSGHDTWEFVGVPAKVELRGIDDNGQITLGFRCCFDGDPYGQHALYTGIEKVIGSAPSELGEYERNRVIPTVDRSGNDGFRGLSFIVDGSTATSIDTDLSVPLELENFNSFRGGVDYGGNPMDNTISVLSTDYPLEIRKYKRIEVGFVEDPVAGDTAGINHDLTLDGTVVVVSDYNGAGHDIVVDRADEFTYQVTGLTPATIRYQSWVAGVTLWGANEGVDRFVVEANESRLTMYGAGYNDTFIIGGTETKDLDQLPSKVVNVIGGEGTDTIYVRDENSTGRNTYRLRHRWLFHSPDPRGDATRDFRGLWYTQAEGLTVYGNDLPSIFRVTPSETVSYNLRGEGPVSGDGDKLMLVDNVPDHQLLFQTSTYWFGPPHTGVPKSIRYVGIEQLSERGTVAVGTSAGVAPKVEVFDEWTREKRFDINPYPSQFEGGVKVATGYVLAGATPAVVTAPASHGNGTIKVFDGRTGEFASSFQAFGGETGGYDVAVGNVLGDSKMEIIVSRLDHGNEVQVWSQEIDGEGNIQWQLSRTLNPFVNAPAIGTRIAVGGDYNFDGYEDIVAGAGPGWLPQVAIYEVDQTVHQLHRFLAHSINFRGGLFVEAGNVLGNRKSDVLVSLAPTDANPFPNVVRTFRGERLFRNAGGHVLSPDRESRIFGGAQETSLSVRDADFDERVDHLFAAISGPNQRGRIKVLDSQFRSLDQFFAEDDDFLNGANLG